MKSRRRQQLIGLGAAIVLAATGIAGVVTHNPVHAAGQSTATVQTSDKNVGESTDQVDPAGANQQDVIGTDTQDTGSIDTADTAATDASDSGTTGKAGVDTDPTAPCAGTGAAQTGNCSDRSADTGTD